MENNITSQHNSSLNPNIEVELSDSDIVITCIYLIIFVLGSTGNLLVIRYFAFQCKSKHPYNTYLIHLAISDLISAIVTPLHFVYGVLSGNKWYFGPIPCILLSIIGPVTINVSSWILASIAFERYRGIVNPLKPRWTKTKIHVTVACIWFVSFVTLIPYILSMKLRNDTCVPYWKNSVYELSSAVGTLLLQSVLPICFMFFTISRILKTLRTRLKIPSSMSSNSTSSNTCMNTSSVMTPRGTTPLKRMSQISRFSNREDATANLARDSSIKFKISADSTSSSFYKRNSARRNSPRFSVTSSVYSMSSRSSTKRPEKEMLLPSSTTNLTVRHCVNNNRSFSVPNLKDYIPILNSDSNPASSQEGGSSVYNSAIQIQVIEPEARFSKEISGVPPEISFGTRTTFRQRRCGRMENPAAIFKGIDNRNIVGKLNPALRKKSISMCALNRYYLPKDETPPVQNTMLRPRKKISSTYRKFRNMLTQQRKRERSRNRKQHQTIRMLVVTFTVFVICSLPYNIFYVVAIVLFNFLGKTELLQILMDLHLWLSTLVVTNCIMNCYIYAGMNTAFRQYACNLFSKNKTSIRKTLRSGKASMSGGNTNVSTTLFNGRSSKYSREVYLDSETIELQKILVTSKYGNK